MHIAIDLWRTYNLVISTCNLINQLEHKLKFRRSCILNINIIYIYNAVQLL